MRVRAMTEGDLEAADRIVRIAFGTHRGLPDPGEAFGEAQYVRTRFRAAPGCAWVAEDGGDVVGSVFATRWGSFGSLGPLTVQPELWDRGIASRLLEPVMDAFDGWELQQAGLFTFANSPRHLGLYQKFGFWPGFLTVVLAKPVAPGAGAYALYSQAPGADSLAEIRELTEAVFPGLDLEREVLAVSTQGIGDTVLVRRESRLEGMAVCQYGPGSEADRGVCYVKFGAVRPAPGASRRFETLLDACEAFAVASGAERLVAGVNTGRLDAYRRMLARGFRAVQIGVSMRLHPESPDFDTPAHYVIDDLR
jgi:predicted N-acetyltransferase YhbS